MLPRPSRALLSLLLVLAMTAMVAYMVQTATGFTRSPRTAPLLIGIPTLFLLFLQISRDVRAMVAGDRTGATASAQEADRYGASVIPEEVRERATAGDRPQPLTVTSEQPGAKGPASASPVIGTLWVLLLIIIVWLLGMFIAIPTYIVLFMRFFGRETWRLSLSFAVGTSIATYLFFVLILDVQLAPGQLSRLVPFL
jgi:uncharacterized integral membrane protein